jgi:hypothetical protein
MLSNEIKGHKPDPDPAFAAQFVHRFGANNLVAVPRTLQAWEYRFTPPNVPSGPHERTLDYDKAGEKPPDKRELEGILYSFSATLATATTSHQLDPAVAGDIVNNDDTLAMSWLLTDNKHVYDKDFLVAAFNHGVVDRIAEEARQQATPHRSPPITGREGTPLSDDPKVAILNCVSRNPWAATTVLDPKNFRPIELPRPGKDPVEVQDVIDLLYKAKFSDHGAAVGRMFDSAHAKLVMNNDPAAKGLADRIIGISAANKHSDVKRVADAMARIGARQPTTEAGARAALETVRHDPHHPARELLLGEMAQIHETAKSFAEAAAIAAKNKVKKDKSPELRSLQETEDAWNVIPTLQEDPSTANLAETVTEEGIHDAAKGNLKNEARRGLAKAITADAAGFARSVTALTQTPKVAEPAAAAAELEGIHIYADEFAAAVADLMTDPDAKQTIEAGAGNLTGNWAGKAASSFIDELLGKPWARPDLTALTRQSTELGNYLCAIIRSETKAAENKAKAAVDALTGMRVGANIFSMGVDFASGLVPGGKIATAGGKFLFGKGMDILKGGTGIEGARFGLESGLKGMMSDELKSREGAAWAEAKVEVADALPMARDFVRDSVAAGLLQQTLQLASPAREQALAQMRLDAEAIKAAGLVEPSGHLRIPLAGTPEYTKYTDFLENNPSFAGSIDTISQGVANNFTDCMTKTLIVKTTGK